MKKHLQLTIILIFTSFLYLQSATLITLTAKQATGGALIKTSLNDSAIYFPAAKPLNDRIVWSVPGTLPAGLYQLDIDFYQAAGVNFSFREYISFEDQATTQLGFLDLSQLGNGTGASTKSIGFYSPNVLSTIALIKSVQNNLPTFGIRAIRISNGTEAAMASKQFVFQLPVTGTQITTPIPLPAGSYEVNSSTAIATAWALPGGSNITTPSAKSNCIYLEQAAQPSILSGGPVSSININHYPPTTVPNMSAAGVAPLLTIVDTTNIESRTLKLIGYTGAGLPQLDIFPGGKTVAVVSSWDDGRIEDLQLVDTLTRYGIKGTFMMIAGTSVMLTKMNILEDKGMEIGSHSWSHPVFYNSSPKRCLDEAVESRRFLESKLGHPVISFAYPFDYSPAYDSNGDYVLRSLQSAGYWIGRSTSTGTDLGTVDVMSEPLDMKPTSYFNVSASSIQTKLNAKLLVPGSVFHLWGHSWEIVGTGMTNLRSSLAALANNPSIWYATLGELMVWKYIREQLIIEPNLTTIGDKSFTFKMPWMHSYLRKVPVSITVPAGVTAVEWQGVQYPVVNSRVQLMWNLSSPSEVNQIVTNRNVQFCVNKNQLEVRNFNAGQEIVVYNLSGKEVTKKLAINSSAVSFELASGVYLVRVGDNSSKVVVY